MSKPEGRDIELAVSNLKISSGSIVRVASGSSCMFVFGLRIVRENAYSPDRGQ